MNINFYMPTKVLMGKNIVTNSADLLKQYGNKALIVTGKHSSKVNGSLEDVKEALRLAEINYEVLIK